MRSPSSSQLLNNIVRRLLKQMSLIFRMVSDRKSSELTGGKRAGILMILTARSDRGDRLHRGEAYAEKRDVLLKRPAKLRSVNSEAFPQKLPFGIAKFTTLQLGFRKRRLV